MSASSKPSHSPSPEIVAHYEGTDEVERLGRGAWQLELARTQEILERYLPSPPARVLDVGGGPGAYACWLAKKGYEVHLVDLVPLHVEQARQASRHQPDHPIASVELGDARDLNCPDNSVDAVLMMGPLYHLTERGDRILALCEARRVLCNGGFVLAVGISRFASALAGLHQGTLDALDFVEIVRRDLTDGQHRNPTGNPDYFTTAFFHHPRELKAEAEEAGLKCKRLLAIEGVGWMRQYFEARWEDPEQRERLLEVVRRLEEEPSLLGASPHVVAIAMKDS